MSTAEKRYTAEQYLELERQSEVKHEFFDGQIFAMAGASLAHNTICYNLTGELRERLGTRGCRGLGSDMRVKVLDRGLYTYPDALIFCGEPELEDSVGDTLLNAKVIFEVLSPSTESYDRGRKFANYRRLASLTDYVLISQDSMHVEHYSLAGEGRWILQEYAGDAAVVDLSSVGIEIPLSLLYDRVELNGSKPLRAPYPDR